MENFKGKLSELFKRFINVIGDYKLSMAVIVLASLFEAAAVILENDFKINIPFEENIFRFLISFEFAVILTETVFKNKVIWKLFSIILGALLAGGFAFCIGIDTNVSVFGIPGEMLYEKAQRWVTGYLLLILILIIYFCYKKQKINFGEYLANIFFNLIVIFFFYLVLLIGTALVSNVLDVLILQGSSVAWACEILVTGFFWVPGCILAVNHTEKILEDVLKILIRYILCGLTLCAMAIVYLYILEVIFLWELPSNEIFPILSVLFCLGMPTWIMAGCWNNKTWYSRIISLLPYIFAPLILMQILSMGIRISVNGLTPVRYAGVMLIVFEIGTLLIWHFSRNHLERILPFMSILVAVAFFAPVVNMYRLSAIWQTAWLSKYYNMSVSGAELTEREMDRLNGAYQYMEGEADFENILKGYHIEKDSAEQEISKQHAETQYQKYNLHGCQMVGELDVKGFATMNMVDKSENNEKYNENDELEVDFSNFTFVIRETGETITVDISDFVQRYMDFMSESPDARQEEQSEYMRSFNKIVIDENRVLYINHFQVSYNKGLKDGEDYFEWKSVGTIGGMLLQK